MALPQLKNDVPKYEMTVPSTGEVVKYRPFLVKEQKVLLNRILQHYFFPMSSLY